MIDPRLRQRALVAQPVHIQVRKDQTNQELLDAFANAVKGKIADKTLEGYMNSLRDVVRYFRDPDGSEIPVSRWTKQEVWNYLHFVENNYCASFKAIFFREQVAQCRQRVWVGTKDAATAAREHCAGCAQFVRPTMKHRFNALSKWYKYLTRVGIVPHNFVADIVEENGEDKRGRHERGEKRRNPSVEEMVRLVNGTAHPQKRAFYAASAKWWFRPNEMLMLDRYASFGLASPTGETPAGFERGFQARPELPSFAEGGDLVYLPETKGALDKRKGNRWMVIDAELRPLLEQHFAWWERTVKRDRDGKPLTTKLWITATGVPVRIHRLYPSFFIDDTLRLGLMTESERRNPKRVWTAHCQRHFGEKLLEMHNVPDSWCNHFRGDAFSDARGHYFVPSPEQVRQKYLELVPRIGFQPLPETTRLRKGTLSEKEAHLELLRHELSRTTLHQNSSFTAFCVRVRVGGEELVVPKRVLPSFVYALRAAHEPDAQIDVGPDAGENHKRGRVLRRVEHEALVLRAIGWLA